MSDMRIGVLLVLDSFPAPKAGTETQVWLLAQGLDRAVYKVGFLLLGESEFLAREMPEAARYVVGTRRMRSFAFWRGAWRAMRAARQDGFQIAHTWFNDSALALPLPLKVAGFRVIGSRRDLGFWYTPANLRLLRLNTRFVDRVVCNSEAVRETVMREEGFRREQTDVIYNGVARGPAGIDRAAVRQRLGLPQDAVVGCVVANLRPLKRVQDAIEALAQVPQGLPAIHLAVVGEDRAGEAGSHRDELERIAREHGVADRVHFLGPLTDPMPVIEASDFGVLCSETEGFSNSLLEYLAAGLPAVATDVGGNPELVTDGRNGFLVPAHNPGSLAAAFAKFAAEPEQRVSMGQAGRRRVESGFSPRAMTDAHASIYRAMAPACT